MKKSLLILLLSPALAGCDLYDDYLQDPNTATDAPVAQVFTGAQLGHAAFVEGHTQRIAGVWAGYYTGQDGQYAGVQNYELAATALDVNWTNLYYGCIGQSAYVFEQAEELDNDVLWGAMATLVADGISTAAGAWDRVPFFETDDPELFPFPAFDDPVEIIDSCINLLQEAEVRLETGAGSLQGDIYLQQNPDLWRAMAQLLRFRLLIWRERDEEARALFPNLFARRQPRLSWAVPHAAAEGQRNFMFELQTGTRAGELSSTGALVVDVLEGKENPKTSELVRTFYFLDDGPQADTFVPNVGNFGLYAEAAPFYILHSSETLLLAAELYARSGDEPQALFYLNNYRFELANGWAGRMAPSTYDAYVADDFEEGGMAHLSGESSQVSLLAEIWKEQYLHHFGSLQGFILLQRIRDKAGALSLPSLEGSRRALRLPYPQVEVQSNPSTPTDVSIATARILFP